MNPEERIGAETVPLSYFNAYCTEYRIGDDTLRARVIASDTKGVWQMKGVDDDPTKSS
jgi:hypothetical protein